MSISVHVSPWADDKGVLKVSDEELRLCLDRSSDSDSQLELTELIESITCKEDSEPPSPLPPGHEEVADVVQWLLDKVESAEAGSPRRLSAELNETGAREIDCDRSRDAFKSHRKADTPRKVRRKRDRDHERKKSQRRSSSCSTTSSACSDISRKIRRKHKHHKTKGDEVKVPDPAPSPRVNPIFLWVKQDDTRIVEVLCEDYDKRNRIRLTKTAHGWRSVPRTERLDSTLSKSSLDLSPTLEQTPPLVAGKPEPEECVETKENQTSLTVARRKKNRCDKRRRGRRLNTKFNCVDKYRNVDVVNNNNSSISNNNKIKIENTLSSECSISEPSLRSFGYKKACHGQSKVDCKLRKKDNKKLDIDVYTFVSTPKTESDNDSLDQNFDFETDKTSDLKIKPEPQKPESEQEESANTEDDDGDDVTPIAVKSELVADESKSEEPVPAETKTEEVRNETTSLKSSLNNEDSNQISLAVCIPESNNILPEENVSSSTQETTETFPEGKFMKNDSEIVDSSLEDNIDKKTGSVVPEVVFVEPKSQSEEDDNIIQTSNSVQTQEILSEPEIESKTKEASFKNESSVCVDSSSHVHEDVEKEAFENLEHTIDDREDLKSAEEQQPEEDNLQPEVILPEPHLQTPEHTFSPVPEPSTTEPEIRFPIISLQPDTSLDSDTLHLPDTTTKSETSLLISTDISLGQSLSIKQINEIALTPSITSGSLRPDVKLLQNDRHSKNEIKTAEMIREEEIERQITADLDEDHLLAIEEILQGEECVEDFDDDDLPEAYAVSPESPVNLVIDLKSKDHVDNTGIPLSLRTDDFLDIYHSPIPMKGHSGALSPLPLSKNSQESVVKAIPPAHQQSKTKFLESILSCPKRCHKDSNKKADSTDQQEPLYLGVSRKSASPTVSSSDGRKFSSPELEPKPKRMKIEDITLKAILNKNKEIAAKTKVSKTKETDGIQQTADSTTKSRLLELLTNESDEHINKLDPLTQLKEILSDPDLNVPDPLLVPRGRLASLVANPGKEIPRLLAMKSESLSYPKLLTDPDLLVVSLSHLQSLLQAAGKEEEIMKYQQKAQLIQQQMKQEQSTLDAATAAALNQMMWLPYLSQLEAAAMACGNTQDFMAMLNMVFPSGGYSQMNPYMMSSPTPGINPYDYKSQLEFQQAFALWNDAMMQAASNPFASQSLGSTTATSNSNNHISKLYQTYQDSKHTPKSQSNSTSKQQEAKYTSARTSPMSLNYPQGKYRSSQYPYTSMFSIPTSTPTTSYSSRNTSSYKTTTTQSSLPSSLTSSLTAPVHSQQPYQASKQKGYSYNYNYNYPPLKTSTVPYNSSSTPKADPTLISAINPSDLYKHQQNLQRNSFNSGSCKSLMNILSKPKQSEVKHLPSPANRVYPTSTTMFPREPAIKPTPPPPVKQDPPKLKVKQPQHLVDPNSKPKLFNFDEHGEVGSTTGSLTPHVDETHSNLWHPLFSSHQQKSYSSPWQWTTPVTVSGE